MKPRNWLIGVSHIGMVLVLELWFSARSSSQGSSHSVNGLPLAAALLTVAAGYRVSGFVQWHMADALRRCSETVCYLGSYRQCLWRPSCPRYCRTVVRADACWVGVSGRIMQKGE